MYCVCVKMKFNSNKAIEILKNLASATLEEDGCLLYEIHKSLDDDLYFLYESFSDKEAFLAHQKSEHFLKFSKELEKFLVKKEIEFYESINLD